MDFQNIEISGASIAGATGADRFSGAVSVGAGGVSFFSGSGNDTFVFTSVTQSGAGGTAYFWNEHGTDSIVIGGAALLPMVSRLCSVLHRRIDEHQLHGQYPRHGCNQQLRCWHNVQLLDGSQKRGLLRLRLNDDYDSVRRRWFGHFEGGAFEAAGGTSIFSNVKPAGGSTGLFGIAGSIPSFS